MVTRSKDAAVPPVNGGKGGRGAHSIGVRSVGNAVVRCSYGIAVNTIHLVKLRLRDMLDLLGNCLYWTCLGRPYGGRRKPFFYC